MKIKPPQGCSEEVRSIVMRPFDDGYESFLISQTDENLKIALQYFEEKKICRQKAAAIRKEMQIRKELQTQEEKETDALNYTKTFQKQFAKEWNEIRRAAGKLKTESRFRKHIMNRFEKVN